MNIFNQFNLNYTNGACYSELFNWSSISSHYHRCWISRKLLIELFPLKLQWMLLFFFLNKKKMKIFQIIQRHFAILGISPSSNRSSQTYSFNGRILFGFLLYVYLIPSQFLYIFRVANGFIDYVDCICSTSASILMLVGFAAMVFQKQTLFECIDKMEKQVNTSKMFSCFKFYIRNLITT